MAIELSDPVVSRIEDLVASGRYATADDCVAEALDRLADDAPPADGGDAGLADLIPQPVHFTREEAEGLAELVLNPPPPTEAFLRYQRQYRESRAARDVG